MTSKVVYKEFNPNMPQQIESHVQLTEIEDDASYFQFGYTEPETLFEHKLSDVEQINQTDTDEYAFIGLQLQVDYDPYHKMSTWRD